VNSTKHEKADMFFYYIKNFFWVLLFLSIAPTIISNIKTSIVDAISPKTDVGYLKMNGVLYDSSYYLKRIDAFSKDANIKGLIIKINSPGGMPGSAQAIYSELKKFKQKKPVVVVVENLCASAAYYVAAASSKIIANPSSLVGSVGVILELPNIKDLLNSWKIKYSYIQSGKYKTAGSPMKETSGAEIDYLQKLADNTYAQFIKDVAQSRNISAKDSTKWADGKIFTGTQALDLKLIDQLGTLEDGIDVIKKLAKIETEVKLIHPQKTSTFLRLFGADDEEYGMEGRTVAESVGSFASQAYSTFMHQQASESNAIRIE
jgi:protease-4